MDEQEAISLVMAFKEDIFSIRSNVQEIKEIARVQLELENEQNLLLQPEIDTQNLEQIPEPEPVETIAMTQAAEDYETLIHFEYMQTVTCIVIAAVLMLSLGVQLFQAFNKHWR